MRHRILMISLPIVALGLVLSMAYFAPAPQRSSLSISLAEYGNTGGAGNQNANIGLPGAGSAPIVAAAKEWRVLILVGLVLVVIAVVSVALLARRRRAAPR